MPGNRGEGIHLPPPREQIGLPPRVFLYTLDQLAVMLHMTVHNLSVNHLYFEGRSIGVRRKSLMIARNIADPEDKPDWRVAEREFLRWMRMKGFRYYDRGAVSS